MPLSDKSAANAKPGVKPYRLFDGKGLYLEVAPSASKYWRVKYRFGSKGMACEVRRGKLATPSLMVLMGIYIRIRKLMQEKPGKTGLNWIA